MSFFKNAELDLDGEIAGVFVANSELTQEADAASNVRDAARPGNPELFPVICGITMDGMITWVQYVVVHSSPTS